MSWKHKHSGYLRFSHDHVAIQTQRTKTKLKKGRKYIKGNSSDLYMHGKYSVTGNGSYGKREIFYSTCYSRTFDNKDTNTSKAEGNFL